MKIEKDTVVSLTYELKAGDAQGPVVEKVDESAPFVFLFGSGHLLKDFEDNLMGLEPGKSFEFTINSDNAYGAFSDDAVIDIPKNVFEVDGRIEDGLLNEGNYLTLEDQHGNPLRGKVTQVGNENVKMDFNHPLAGHDLHFKGGVVDVRKATETEIAHGHVHGPGGHHH
ncbi:MAG: FKBP-type peptidyl-prolyl cis-trans isomerase [Chitinophagales bacterium]|nr:FKBP-type peptidyl-prolyl cis-trans isomerase [Chitinophagales bacterium]